MTAVTAPRLYTELAAWWPLMSAPADAGFKPKMVPFDHSELEPGEYEIFVASKP